MALVSQYRAQEPTDVEQVICQSIMSCLGASLSSNNQNLMPLAIAHSSSDPSSSSVDSYFSGILQAVTGNNLLFCSNCEDGTPASCRCRDCSEVLCEPCLLVHRRVRCTKDQRINRFSRESVSRGTSISLTEVGNSPSYSQISTSPGSSPNLNYCDLHQEVLRIYCNACKTTICFECATKDHRAHHVVLLQEFDEPVKSLTTTLNTETKAAIVAVREAMDSIQKMCETVDVRAHQVAIEARSSIRKCIRILEERERELLIRIDHFRQVKGRMLMSQRDRLKQALNKLAKTSNILNEALDGGSGFDLMVANEKASIKLTEVRSLRFHLKPCEDANIVFIPPDNNFLRAISHCGGVATPGDGTLRRQQYDANGVPLIPPVEASGQVEFNNRGSSRGRPLFGLPYPVTVKETGPIPSLIIGSEGKGIGEFCRPWGVCCDRRGRFIVADRSNDRIQVFHPNGAFLYTFGSHGNAPGEFDRPAGITVDVNDRIIVADKDNHRVQIFKIDGTFVLQFGEKGCRNGQFNYPWDVAVNSNCQIVVTDTRNHRVQLFSPEGVFLCKYGFEGANSALLKQFDSPRGVCFTPRGTILVTDFNNHRILAIDPTLKYSQYLGIEGTGLRQFFRPQGIICDDEGRIVVVDTRNSRIQVLNNKGNFLWKICHQGTKYGEVDRPSGIALTPEGRIVVVDFGNSRVQVF